MNHLSRRTVLLLLVSILLPVCSYGDEAASLFNRAGEAYTTGDFTGASELYEQYIGEYGYSANALYNLGNSYSGAGHPGRAILAYERALRLAPADSDILNNLATVKKDLGLFDREQTLGEQLIGTLSINQWSLLGLAALGALTGITLISLRKKVSPGAMRATVAISLVTIVLSCYCTFHQYRNWTGSIVTTAGNRLMISPFEGAASVGDIKPGRKVTIRERYGSFVNVEDDSKRRGWLPETVIEPIIPATPHP